MLYVINVEYGGFDVPAEVEAIIGDKWDYDGDIRANAHLIEWVKAHANETDLAVVEIPAEATDWEVIEYDGYEYVIAVVDGKIHHLYGEE